MRFGRSQQSWMNKVTDLMKSINVDKYVAVDLHLSRLGIHRRFLAVCIQIINFWFDILSFFSKHYISLRISIT
jgi:hypothetical protein